ncbi:hypothetical protein ATO13_21201 [Stappia sp. 22II-S9-Z10]|nr:hypothetical protein ATO13_21201 [Stappia sp. 22II-S9-Z10]
MDAFQTTTPIADTLATLLAGIDVTTGGGFELRLQYDGAFSDDLQSQGGSVRLGYRF